MRFLILGVLVVATLGFQRNVGECTDCYERMAGPNCRDFGHTQEHAFAVLSGSIYGGSYENGHHSEPICNSCYGAHSFDYCYGFATAEKATLDIEDALIRGGALGDLLQVVARYPGVLVVDDDRATVEVVNQCGLGATYQRPQPEAAVTAD